MNHDSQKQRARSAETVDTGTRVTVLVLLRACVGVLLNFSVTKNSLRSPQIFKKRDTWAADQQMITMRKRNIYVISGTVYNKQVTSIIV